MSCSTLKYDNIHTVKGKRGNVEINNSPKRELNRGPLDLKSSTLPNELKRYPSSAVLVVHVVLVNPNHYNIAIKHGKIRLD